MTVTKVIAIFATQLYSAFLWRHGLFN